MDIIVAAVALGMIISKFLDCHSTVKGLDRFTGAREQNKFAQKLMVVVGQNPAIWYIFIFAVAIIIFSTWLLYSLYPAPAYKISYILLGLFITVVQLAVAFSNYTGRGNFITWVLKKSPLYHSRRNP